MSLAFAVALSLAAQTKPEPPPIVAIPVSPPPVLVPTPPVYAPPPPPPPAVEGAWRPAQPRMPLIYYFTEDDYPAVALRNGDEGITAFRLTVGTDGRVSDCTVTSSSGSTALDAATCRILRARARFSPATDGSGNPRESHVVSRARWVLPPEPSLTVPDIELLAEATAALVGAGVEQPRPLDALSNLFAAADYPAEAIAAETLADTDLRLAIGVDGRVAGCTVVASSGLSALDDAACRVLFQRARFAPAHRAGGPVASTLVTRIHWREEPEAEEEPSPEVEDQAGSATR